MSTRKEVVEASGKFGVGYTYATPEGLARAEGVATNYSHFKRAYEINLVSDHPLAKAAIAKMKAPRPLDSSSSRMSVGKGD